MEHPRSLKTRKLRTGVMSSSMTSCVPVSLPIFNLRSRVSLKNDGLDIEVRTAVTHGVAVVLGARYFQILKIRKPTNEIKSLLMISSSKDSENAPTYSSILGVEWYSTNEF